MENRIVLKGKKLGKKELRMVKGGLEMCVNPDGYCIWYSNGCAEPKCKEDQPREPWN